LHCIAWAETRTFRALGAVRASADADRFMIVVAESRYLPLSYRYHDHETVSFGPSGKEARRA